MAGVVLNNVSRSIDLAILKNTNGSETVKVQDNDGLSIQNTAGTNSVTLAASGSTELTIIGNLKFNSGSNLDLNENQALKFRVENFTGSDPSAGNAGRLIFRTDTTSFKYDDGTSFIAVASATSAFTGDVSTTSQGYLSSGAGSNVLKLHDPDGVQIGDSLSLTPTNTVVLKATGAPELTVLGAMIVQRDGGLTVKNTAGTNSVAITATGSTALTIGGSVTVTNLTDSGLTSGRVTFAGASGLLSDSSVFTFSAGTLTATNVTATSAVTAASITDSGLTVTRIPYASTGGLLADNANLTWDNTNVIFTVGGGATARMVHTAGTLATGTNAFSRTATLNASAVTETAVLETITSSGSGVVSKIGRTYALAAGYTAAGGTYSVNVTNTVAGTGADLQLTTSETGILGNQAMRGLTSGSTATGYNVGSHGEAGHGLFNVGSLSKAVTATNATNNIGAIGVAANASANNVGGYFALGGSSTPTFTSAALLIDNGAVAAPIFIAKDNASTVFIIADGGATTISTSLTVSNLTSTRVTFASTAGLLADSANLTFNTGTNTLTATNISGSTSITSPSVTASGLTAGRVTFAGVGGLLSDDADLTFVTDTLTATKISTTQVTDSGLTAGRVTFAGVGGLLSDDADLTFSVDTLTATKLSTTQVTDSGLTNTRLTFAGSGGLLSDSANLTYDGTTLTAKAAVIFDTDTGVSFKDGNATPVEGTKIRVLSVSTTTGAPTEMTVDGNSLTLANNETHAYTVYITARSDGASTNVRKSALFKFEVAANAAGGTAAIIGTEYKTVIANEMDGTWDVSVSVSTNKIKFNVQGAAGDNITWRGWLSETTILAA